MTETEQQLNRLRDEIEYHRKKAASLRKRAEGQDRIADDKVKIAAELGTPQLPIVDNPVPADRNYPQLARTAAYPPCKPNA